MKINNFERKVESIQAVQLTLENSSEVAEWSGGELFKSYPEGNKVFIMKLNGIHLAVGDWVAQRKDGHFYYISDYQMKLDFKEVQPEVHVQYDNEQYGRMPHGIIKEHVRMFGTPNLRDGR